MSQPKALFLADVMHNDPCSKAHHNAAALELRRLHELNVDKTEIIAAISAQRDALLDALRAAVADWDEEVSKGRWLDAARAAIKAVEGEKT